MSIKTKKYSQGLTLIEVMVAVIIMALIGVISYQALDTTVRSKDVVEEHLADLARVDRAWTLLEADLRNIVNQSISPPGYGAGNAIPPLVLGNNEGEYWMTMLRGGHANPLNLIRSEMIRVGYRVEEETLWRDVWYNLAQTDQEEARHQKIADGVERVEVRILSNQASSYTAGPWVESWPSGVNAGGANNISMPHAIEVKLKLLDREYEIVRLYSILEGV
ncbi:MAG: type II secretion system minor pseudopilin GspJ [Agarilytica sp.]